MSDLLAAARRLRHLVIECFNCGEVAYTTELAEWRQIYGKQWPTGIWVAPSSMGCPYCLLCAGTFSHGHFKMCDVIEMREHAGLNVYTGAEV